MNEKITVFVNPEIMDLVEDFFREWKTDIIPLKKALENGDYETIKKWAHNLKGVGSTCGSDALSEMGARLEIAAKDTARDTTAEIIDSLSSYLNHAELAVEDQF